MANQKEPVTNIFTSEGPDASRQWMKAACDRRWATCDYLTEHCNVWGRRGNKRVPADQRRTFAAKGEIG